MTHMTTALKCKGVGHALMMQTKSFEFIFMWWLLIVILSFTLDLKLRDVTLNPFT